MTQRNEKSDIGLVRNLSASNESERQRARIERLLNAAEEIAGIGSFEIDLRTQEVTWSDGLYRLYGYPPGEVEVTIERILERVHPDEQHDHRALTGKMIASSYPATREYRIQLDDGAVRHLFAKSSVERGDDDTPIRLFGVVQDITERRLTERELQAHYALTQALGEWQSFEEGVVDLLRRLGTAMDWDAASMWVRTDRDDALVCRAFWTPPSPELSDPERTTRGSDVPPGEEVGRRAWDRMQPISIDDVSTDPAGEDRTETPRAGLRSGLLFRAVHDGETLAVVALTGRDPRRPTPRMIRTVSALGHDLGRFLAGRRAEIGFRPLSSRELQVLQLAAQGLSGPVIAERLVISPATVKTHFEHIYEKLGVTDRAAAVAEAMRQGLIS